MAINKVALLTALATDAMYDAAVVGGSNAEILRLLHEEDAALSKRWRPITTDDFLNVIAGETLTPAQEDRIRTYTFGRETIPVHRVNVQTWLLNNLSVGAINALKAKSQVVGRPVDAFLDDEDDGASLNDIREAVHQIDKSFINTHQAAMAPITAARIRRLGAIGDPIPPGLNVATTPENMRAKSGIPEPV